jgi:two-component system NtrC family sensor kinase
MTPEEPAPAAQDGLEAFAALAAHQLGEAIALMRGAAAVLEVQHGGAGVSEQDALRALNAGGERAQRYVDDLLDVARAATDPEGPAPSTELDAAFDAAAAELESFLSRVPVHVQREPLPRAALESREAQRLFSHLLRSALAAGATRLGLTGRTTDDKVVVELFDNGAPADVDPHQPTRPFAPFAPPRGRGVLIGAGVSLSVCRRLVERRGGRIAMAVRADGATIVTVEIPTAP